MKILKPPKRRLGQSDLHVHPVCLGTMTFGEQVDEKTSHAILARSLERGVDFLDTAEMYAVPVRAQTYTVTEQIIGRYFQANPGARQQWTVATKVAGPGRQATWVRGGSLDLRRADIHAACEDSLRRLHTDVIDLYQIHWPVRHVPAFGRMYYEHGQDTPDTASLHEQLEAMSDLVRAGKVRTIGLSNETPYGVMAFLALAQQHGLARVASVQNPYCLVNRVVDNGLDEVLDRTNVGLLAYSPLGFGLLTGKYDQHELTDPQAPRGRLSIYESMQQQRWGRKSALEAARRYNALAREHGLTPAQMALAFCYQQWRVTSTIIGVTSIAQLDECLDAWGTPLSQELLGQIDAIRAQYRDPAC